MNGTFDFRNPYEWRGMVENGGFAPMMLEAAVSCEFEGKEYGRAIPESLSEQLEAVEAAYAQGAVICRVMARNPDSLSKLSTDPEVISELNAEIRRRCPDMLINNCINGGLEVTKGYNMACLGADCLPDMAGLRLGIAMYGAAKPARSEEFTDAHGEYAVDANLITSYDCIDGTVAALNAKGIKPVLEIYQPGQYMVVNGLLRKGLIKPPYTAELLFGFQAMNAAHPAKLLDMLRELPKGAVFFSGAKGLYALPMSMMSILCGGHVRVGIGDSREYVRGVEAESTAQLVARIKALAEEMGREIATPRQARELLDL